MISMSLRPDSVAKFVIWRVILLFTYASMVWAFVALAQSMIYTNAAIQHHQQMVDLVISKGSNAQYGTLCILAASVLLATYIHLNLSVGPQERLRLLKIRAHFLARVFPLQRELRDQILLGDLLVSGGFIDETQLERALNLSRLNGKMLSQTLVTCGWVDDNDIVATVELRKKILNREINQSGAWAMMKACRAAIELHNDLSFAPVVSAPASRTTPSAGVRDTVVNMESHRRSRIVNSAGPEKVEPICDRSVDKQRSFLPFVRKVDVAQTIGSKLAVDCASAPMMLPAAQEYVARAEEFPSAFMSDTGSRNSRLERGIQALRESRKANKIQAVLKCLTFDELQSMEELVACGADPEDNEPKQADDVEFIEPVLWFEVDSDESMADGRDLAPIVDALEVGKVSDASIERKMQSQSHSISVGVTDGRIVPSGVRSVDEGRIVPSRVCFVDGTGVCIVAEYCDE